MSGSLNALIAMGGRPTTPPPTVPGMMQGFQQGQEMATAPLQAIGQAQQVTGNALALKGQMALRSVFADPANIDKSTGLPTSEGMAKLMQADPEMGMKVQQNLQTLTNQRMAAHIQKFNFSDKVQDDYRQANTDAMHAYERAKEGGASEEVAQTAGQEVYSKWYDGLMQSGMVDPDQAKGISPQWNKTTALYTDQYFQQQEEKKRLEKQGWQLAEDPANLDPATGKPTMYRVQPSTGEARTMDNQPYSPKGAQKIGTEAKPPPPGSAAAEKLAIIDDLQHQPGNETLSQGQLDLEADRQLSYAKGTALTPEQRHDMAKQIASYQTAPLTNYALARPGGAAIQSEVTKINPDYQSTFYSQFKNIMEKFGAGAEGNRVRFLNVAVQHLGVAGDAADHLDNENYPAVNSVRLWIKQQTGRDAPVNFDAVKHIVGTEIEKAVAGGIGAVADRDRLLDSLNRANSPEQLHGVISEYKKLMAGQAMGLKKQYEQGTPNTPLFRSGIFSFDSKLEPETKKQLGLLGDTAGGAASSGAGQPRAQTDTATPTIPQSLHGMAADLDKNRDGTRLRNRVTGKVYDLQGNEIAPGASPAKPFSAPAPARPAAAPAGGFPVPAEHAKEKDGTQFKDDDGNVYVKRGDRMVPVDSGKPGA